jgi:membrane dipeptidase
MNGGPGRRGFLVAAAGIALAPGARLPAEPASRRRRPPIVDGMGEIHLDYEPALLDAIRESGLTACVVTVGNPALQGATAFEDMKAELLTYDRHIAANPQRLSRATSLADIERAAEDGTLALLYYTQNAAPIEDDLERLAALHALGVRMVQLTYNSRNLLGDGCLEGTNAGLSRFGVDAVARMNELGMLVDVSHCGEATTRDGIALSSKPVAVTHSGCRSVFDHPRNKTDEALRALADRGGVIGIYQINPYLGPRERNSLDDYLSHVDHAVKVAGIEHVGIGSDREHRVIPDTPEEKQKLIDELSRLGPATAQTVRWPFFIGELNHPRRMRTIADALARRGYASDQVDKILGGNWLRLFRDTIG